MAYKLDIPGVVTFLGGPKQIEEDSKALGDEPISAKTVQKWRERGSLPLERYLQLHTLAEHQGKRLEIRNFLKRS